MPVVVSVPVDEWVMQLEPDEDPPIIAPFTDAEAVPESVIKFTPLAPDWIVVDVTETPLFKENNPPAAAVPPPTNVPAFARFVIRATSTVVSTVTVNVFEYMLCPAPFGGTALPPQVAAVFQFPDATAR